VFAQPFFLLSDICGAILALSRSTSGGCIAVCAAVRSCRLRGHAPRTKTKQLSAESWKSPVLSHVLFPPFLSMARRFMSVDTSFVNFAISWLILNASEAPFI